jgi:lipopolysaccharide/colanic/teichoic acid biosynthesis glycosyltransferase
MQTKSIIGKTIRTINSIRNFNKIIKSERSRSDRNNEKFSLLTYDISEFRKNNSKIHQLIDVLSSKIRISDEIGWFNKQRIAILLPVTDKDGANKVANNIGTYLHTVGIPSPLHDIYMYPSPQWIDKESSFNHSFNRENLHEKNITNIEIPFWKRTIDIWISSIGLLLLSPIFLCIITLIKVVSPGSIFYKQERIGKSGKPFYLLKFRTMKENSDTASHREHVKELINGNKPMTKLDNDSRIIPTGKILRRMYLDELPQLINVLRGEMSLVGPRPCIPYEAEEYLRWHTRRFDTVPGMTGIWQIRGKNRRTFAEMIRMDIEYISKQSLWLDIKILVKTPFVILFEVLSTVVKNKKKYYSLQKVQLESELVN